MKPKALKIRWYWYVAKPNEIFLDLDSGPSITRALSVLRRALSVTPSAKTPLNKLDIESVWLYPSVEPKHAHLIVVLKDAMEFYRRVAWSLWMGGDQLRAAYVMEREARVSWEGFLPSVCTFGNPSELLAVRKAYGWRTPDATCGCKAKHKPKPVTDRCPALMEILGEHRSDDYFPRNRDKVRRPPVRFAWGKVPLSNLRAWRSNA